MSELWWKRVLSLSLLIFFSLSLPAQAKIDHVDLDLEPNEVAMTFLNLPDGEATLIQNQKENILINTGGPKSLKSLETQLKLFNVTRIHTLILTHHGLDFRSHVPQIVNHYHVSTIITSSPIKKVLLEPGLPFSIHEVLTTTEQRETTIPNFKIEKQSTSLNGDVNLKLTYGQNTILYLSDIPSFEHAFIGSPVKARILKLSDYGTKSFKDSQILEKIDPEVAILYKKRHVEFNVSLLEHLTDRMTETYNIQQVGDLTFKLTPETYEAITIENQN